MEPRFGHDFSRVRVHTDRIAADSVQAVDAIAYTVGDHLAFGAGRYAPNTSSGQRILAHELAHTLQQRRTPPNAAEVAEVGSPVDAFEVEAESAASAVMSGAERATVTRSGDGALRRLTAAEFRKNLGSNKDQTAAIAALFANKEFVDLWNYLGSCAVKPAQDLGPLELKVTPGLKIGGVERYGGYNGLTRTLEINPTKPEHMANPAELVDTIAHELIHAVDDLQADCKASGAADAPLKGAATVTFPSRASVAGTPDEAKLMKDPGPGASNPCEEFIDINAAAQQLIIGILRSNIATAKVGRPTVTYVNEILRRDPKAMKAYEKCRKPACKEPDADKRRVAMAACSESILTKFMPKALKP
jgi:Domain of unknown function (DUF4157)